MIHSDSVCFSLFESGAQLKRISEYLNQLVGVGIRYDSFTIRNKMWLCFVNVIVLALKSESALSVVVRNVSGLRFWYPQLGGGNEFYVLSNEHLKYSDYIDKHVSALR